MQRLALGDFSHGKLIRDNLNYSLSKTNHALPFGTDVYLAPEVIKEIGDYQKSPAIDIWYKMFLLLFL
jgi:serine/threonine protein kinase